MNSLVLLLSLLLSTQESEQAAALALVPMTNVDVSAVADGEWDNPATWSMGIVPQTDQDVHIPEGRIVLVDHQDLARLSTIRIDGILEFSQTGSSSLKAETIVVTTTGSLIAGTEDSPISGSVTITLIDRGDFNYMGLGRCLLSLGHLSLYSDPLDYELYDPEEAINQDGATEPPYACTHRPITIASETPAPITRRGHVMVMHHPDAIISGVAFKNLGRTDKSKILSSTNPRGRYAFHAHRCDKAITILIKDCYFLSASGWSIVNHSSNVLMKNNLSYRSMGAAFVCEAGDERGSIESNIDIATLGSGDKGGNGNTPGVPHQLVNEARKSVHDYGHLGDGVWLQGPYVTVKNNISNGAKFCGVDTFNNSFKEPDTGVVPVILSRNIPIAEQSGNIALNTEFGSLFTWCQSEGSKQINSQAISCICGSFLNQSVVELHNPTYRLCETGHNGGGDYGGPSRVYGGVMDSCQTAINIGHTRWFGSPQGHAVIQGPFAFNNNTTDILIRQADPGTTELIDIPSSANLSWTYNTKGSLEVRQRLAYQESNRLFLFKTSTPAGSTRQAFFKIQHDTAIPWTSGDLAGKTNLQIFNETGKKMFGYRVPEDAELIDNNYYLSQPLSP